MATSSSVPASVDPNIPPPKHDGGTGALSPKVEFRSHWGYAWNRFKQDRFALYGGILALFLVIAAFSAPLIAPADPLFQFPEGLAGDFAQPVPPGTGQFLLGSDSLGRDFLSRLIWGGRISLTVAVAANVVSITIAVVLGGIAGFLGGWADTAIMRTVDLALGFPALLLQIALATVLPPSLITVIIVITIFGWVYPTRIFRGQILSLRERPFVEAAQALGASKIRIFVKHLLPHLLPTIIVFSTLRVPTAILTEAGLSFLGLGVRPPTPSWGNLILEGTRFYRSAPWLVLYPGLLIMLTILSFNLLGDGLRDALDPREGQTR
jgi:ABC-type dipeptide/oligopeptide/nickel transport system permease subunit